MPIEVERKFLVTGEDWLHQTRFGSQRYRQGYLARGETTVRVRVCNGAGASLAIKSRRRGFVRLEFEYAIPVFDAETFLRKLCRRAVVEKTRHELRFRGHIWTIDEFDGPNAGLVLAEIELSHPCELFDVPNWIGREVTNEERYSNSFLAQASLSEMTPEDFNQLPLPFAVQPAGPGSVPA